MGSAAGCDWQVAAPGVPSIELLFTGEELFAWVEQVRDEIRCNDATLPLGFTQLRHEDRLDLGPARILVSLGADLARLAKPESTKRDAQGATRESNNVGAVEAGGATREQNKVVPHAAELRVRRGASRLPAWTFSPADTGRTVTVGAADECDVQVIAAGVEAHELTVLYAGDTLLVKSARQDHPPKLNGQHLGEEWQFLSDGDRLDMGTACLDVHFSILDLSSSGERQIAEARERSRGEADANVRDRRRIEPEVYVREQTHAREPEAKHREFKGASVTQLYVPRELIPVPQAVLCGSPSSTLLEAPRHRSLRVPPPPPAKRASVETPSPKQSSSAPPLQWADEGAADPELVECLFAPGPTVHTGRKRRYVAALIGIVCGYAGWLALLEHFWPGW